MAYYPDPNQPQAAHPAQQPWPSGAQPQNLSGNTPVPSMPSGSPAYPAAFPQAWQAGQQPARNYRPFLLALLAFPFTALKMFVWPGPATFAKEKDRVGGGTVLFLLLVGGALTGLFAYLWGRLSRLAPGIENLSAGRVVPQPLARGYVSPWPWAFHSSFCSWRACYTGWPKNKVGSLAVCARNSIRVY